MRFADPKLRRGPGLHLFLFGPGYGESIALRTQESGWIVVDSLQRREAGRSVNPALDLVRDDPEPLACLLLTHPHADHAHGMADLVAAAMDSGGAVACVERFQATPPAWDTDPVVAEDPGAPAELGKVEAATEAIRRAWRSDRAYAWRVIAGQPEGFGDLAITPLWPTPEAANAWDGRAASANEVSTPVMVEWGRMRLLLGADLPSAQWELANAQGHCVPFRDHAGCKVPHHASRGAHHEVWARGARDRAWAVTGWSGARKLPRLEPGEGAETLLGDIERLMLTALPFAADPGSSGWELTLGEALALRERGRVSAGWGRADDAPHSGPLDGWLRIRFNEDGSPAEVQYGDRSGCLIP
ncbi:MAG: hypothetical protein V7607_6100 [Solirubrobacteraceae bacterium]